MHGCKAPGTQLLWPELCLEQRHVETLMFVGIFNLEKTTFGVGSRICGKRFGAKAEMCLRCDPKFSGVTQKCLTDIRGAGELRGCRGVSGAGGGEEAVGGGRRTVSPSRAAGPRSTAQGQLGASIQVGMSLHPCPGGTSSRVERDPRSVP